MHTVLKMSRNCFNLLSTFAVIVAFTCGFVNAGFGSVPEDDPRYINLPAENITCIERELNRTNIVDLSCAVIQEDVARIYEIHNAEDILDGLESLLRRDSTILEAFCQPSCMQTFFDAWETCSSFDELSNVADLLIGLCSTNNGRPCYTDLEQLNRAIGDSIDCVHELQPEFGDCNTNCRILLNLDVETYGCCLNVLPSYVKVFDPSESEEFDYIFDVCRVRRPAVCPTTPSLPDPTVSTAYPSAPCSSTDANNQQVNENPQANQQGARNGSSQSVAVAAALLLLNSLIAVFIQLP